jgi:hypothetical protein
MPVPRQQDVDHGQALRSELQALLPQRGEDRVAGGVHVPR